VVQTGVKSFGCKKRTTHELPFQIMELDASLACFRFKIRCCLADLQELPLRSRPDQRASVNIAEGMLPASINNV